jgi:hypothetical protein
VRNVLALLQGVEEAVDEVALAVESEVGLSRFLAVGFQEAIWKS